MHNPSVWHNINRLHDHLADPHFKGDKISLLIDCNSGEFSIPQPIGDLKAKMQSPKRSQGSSSQFKHAKLTVLSSGKGEISFEWVDSDKNIPLTEKASRILKLTLEEINRCGGQTKSGSAKDALSNCLSSVDKELSQEIANQSAWRGALQRMEAEKLLQKSPPGTYLLRNGDPFTREIEYNLAKYDPFSVRCFVMTVVGKNKNIFDKVLIQRPNGWAIYNDNLDLSDYQFKDLSEIITKAGGEKPFEAGRAA
jgi:hypothetical protein